MIINFYKNKDENVHRYAVRGKKIEGGGIDREKKKRKRMREWKGEGKSLEREREIEKNCLLDTNIDRTFPP